MRTLVGIAHADYASRLVREVPELIDFIEIPFEQLIKTPSAIEIRDNTSIILHCASLSLAGNVPPKDKIVRELEHWIKETGTPWLGEHLAYIQADGQYQGRSMHEALVGGSDSFSIGYTVNPQFSESILDRVISNSEYWSKLFNLPIILENGPTYFDMPGSTMSQLEFIQKLCTRSLGTGLLLDLSHLTITCENLGINTNETLLALPTERIVEIHISGTHIEGEIWWDDHSRRAPNSVFELLESLQTRVKPKAITLEYNWDGNFPTDTIIEDINRIRETLSRTPL